jgi:hypothetical protein
VLIGLMLYLLGLLVLRVDEIRLLTRAVYRRAARWKA